MNKDLEYLKHFHQHREDVLEVWIRAKKIIPRSYRLKIEERILKHDLTKLDSIEWEPYKEHFYSNKQNKEVYKKAKKRHRRLNKHHSGFWIARKVDKPTRMELASLLELLADWGAMALHNRGVLAYYEKFKASTRFHPETEEIFLKLAPFFDKVVLEIKTER